MVPNVAGTGTSFKGAALYYLHDKRQEGEDVRLTQERVAWTETRNLATADPELAWKIMAATALDQDRLKAQAGVRATGRKSANAVYAYSIAWHPQEVGRIGQAEMLRAAEETIRVLGAEDRQVLIIAHNDTAHPHVHVLINRVSPQDGRMLGTSNDYKKLDAWALAYRQQRGEERLYCPARAEKREAIDRKAEGAEVAFVRGAPSTPRAMVAELAAAKEAGRDALRAERTRQSALNGALGAQTRAMHEAHRAAWAALSKGYAHRKSEVYTQAKTRLAAVQGDITTQYRPSWRDLLRRQWQSQKAFDARERSLSGKISNAIQALSQASLEGADGAKGLLSSALNLLVSRAARQKVLDQEHAREKRFLKAQEKAARDRAYVKMKADRTALLAAARAAYAAERAALILRQDADKTAMQTAWRDRKTDMARSFDHLAREAAAREAALAILAQEPERSASPYRKAFNQAGRGPTNDRPKRTRRR